MGRIFYILLTVLAVAGTGCSSKKSGSSGGGQAYDGGSGLPPVTTPDPRLTPDGGGATIDLTLNKFALDQYVGKTTYLPTDLKVTVNLRKQATFSKAGGGFDYGFGGYVSIKFKDNGTNFTDIFSSLWLSGQANTVGSNSENHKYNLLSSSYPGLEGSMGYHGFFEDTRPQRCQYPPEYAHLCIIPPSKPLFGGAVILVIDSMNDLGDGAGPSSANGSVWFKNYVNQYPGGLPQLTSCWFISKGPYDCRSWKSGSGVNTKASIYPDSGYVKLGDFFGLDMKKAFNNEI